jgi:hypothetical protein
VLQSLFVVKLKSYIITYNGIFCVFWLQSRILFKGQLISE